MMINKRVERLIRLMGELGMKKASLVFIGFLLVLPLTMVSAADRFNDRSVDWTRAAPAASVTPNPPAEAAVDRFNERRTAWVSEAPSASSDYAPREAITVTPRGQGFND